MSITKDLIETKYVIRNGPSRDHLFNAVEYAMDKNVDLGITFTCFEENSVEGDDQKIYFRPKRIDGIAHDEKYEKGGRKGQSFIVSGYADASQFTTLLGPGKARAICRFSANYFTDDRTGSLEIYLYCHPHDGSPLYASK